MSHPPSLNNPPSPIDPSLHCPQPPSLPPLPLLASLPRQPVSFSSLFLPPQPLHPLSPPQPLSPSTHLAPAGAEVLPARGVPPAKAAEATPAAATNTSFLETIITHRRNRLDANHEQGLANTRIGNQATSAATSSRTAATSTTMATSVATPLDQHAGDYPPIPGQPNRSTCKDLLGPRTVHWQLSTPTGHP